jgi:hypothetical protein
MRVICPILYVVAIVLLCCISCFCGHMAIVFLLYTRMKLVNYFEALWYACRIIWCLYYLTNRRGELWSRSGELEEPGIK